MKLWYNSMEIGFIKLGEIARTNDLMLEDLTKIYEDITLGCDEAMINWWRSEDLETWMLIKLGMCAKFGFHMKITKLEDWCS